MNNIKVLVGALIVGLLAGAYITKSYFPEVKEVQTEKEIIKTDVKIITRVVERPDGSKETIIETTDRTVKREDKNFTKTENKAKNVKASLIAKYSFAQKKEDYGILLEKRILGPVFIGVYGDTSKQVGLSIGMEL